MLSTFAVVSRRQVRTINQIQMPYRHLLLSTSTMIIKLDHFLRIIQLYKYQTELSKKVLYIKTCLRVFRFRAFSAVEKLSETPKTPVLNIRLIWPFEYRKILK